MRSIKTSIFKTIAVIAFIGLTIGGPAGTRSANAGTDSIVPENQGATDTINDTGSGSGGSTDTGTSDTGSSYQEGTSDSSTGSGTGGSTDIVDTDAGRLMGTGPHYGTAPLGGPSGDYMRATWVEE